MRNPMVQWGLGSVCDQPTPSFCIFMSKLSDQFTWSVVAHCSLCYYNSVICHILPVFNVQRLSMSWQILFLLNLFVLP